MRLLIIYATTEGHTEKICSFMYVTARKLEHEVDLKNATQDPPPPDAYDVVIVAASLHMFKYQTAIKHYVTKYAQTLNAMPSAFLSVSLSAHDPEDELSWREMVAATDNLMSDASWKPLIIEYVAGALLYTEYNFFKRYIMRAISKKMGRSTDVTEDHVYTDWNQVESFVMKMLKLVA